MKRWIQRPLWKPISLLASPRQQPVQKGHLKSRSRLKVESRTLRLSPSKQHWSPFWRPGFAAERAPLRTAKSRRPRTPALL